MATTSTPTVQQLRDAYRRVTDAIGQAAAKSDRKASDVVLVAVTKNASPDQIRTLVEMGHADLGESRVQQLVQRTAGLNEFMSRRRSMAVVIAKPKKAQGLPPQVRWHMIGHLQRNKIKQVIPLVRLTHSIDNLRTAEEVHHLAGRMDRVAEVLIQVNVSGEATKFGVALPAAIHLAEQIDTMAHLKLRGIMTMAPKCEDPEDARPVFALAADLFRDMRSANVGGDEFNILSMGMSDDYQIAIEEGANLVRVGRALFGEGDPATA